MYASIEEILNAVAAGELTPEEADREIEALQARAGAAGSRAQQSARRSVSGIYGRDIGAVRCLPQEDGTLRLQRFCIRKDCRGQGAGRQTLAAVENRFRAEGLSAVVLDAKCSARGFYEACGYEAVSGEFLEAGVPHVAMRRAL